MKKKKIFALVVLILIIILYITLTSKYFNRLKENRIQARLIEVGEHSYVELPRLYEGSLTFQNLDDLKIHKYFVCLEDWSTVQIGKVYDLPVDYYKPHGGPNQSNMTNGCNGPLYLSK